jgi:hypothetical protein
MATRLEEFIKSLREQLLTEQAAAREHQLNPEEAFVQLRERVLRGNTQVNRF